MQSFDNIIQRASERFDMEVIGRRNHLISQVVFVLAERERARWVELHLVAKTLDSLASPGSIWGWIPGTGLLWRNTFIENTCGKEQNDKKKEERTSAKTVGPCKDISPSPMIEKLPRASKISSSWASDDGVWPDGVLSPVGTFKGVLSCNKGCGSEEIVACSFRKASSSKTFQLRSSAIVSWSSIIMVLRDLRDI